MPPPYRRSEVKLLDSYLSRGGNLVTVWRDWRGQAVSIMVAAGADKVEAIARFRAVLERQGR